MVNNYLVGGIPTPLKNMSSSVGMMTFPIWKVIKTMFQSPPARKEPALFFFFSFSSSSPSCRVHHGVRVNASVKHQWTLGLAELPWCPSNNHWIIMVQFKHYPLDHFHSFSPWNSPIIPWNSGSHRGSTFFSAMASSKVILLEVRVRLPGMHPSIYIYIYTY